MTELEQEFAAAVSATRKAWDDYFDAEAEWVRLKNDASRAREKMENKQRALSAANTIESCLLKRLSDLRFLAEESK